MKALQHRASGSRRLWEKNHPPCQRWQMARTTRVAKLRTSLNHSRRGPIIGTTTLPSTMTPAWIVYAWDPVLWDAASPPDLHLVHLGTRVLSFGDDDGPCSGQTLWGGHSETCAAGVAWDRVEVRRGVVAMSDPLGMVTNLRLLDADGAKMSATRIAVHLHQLVHALPWQSEVKRALQKPS